MRYTNNFFKKEIDYSKALLTILPAVVILISSLVIAGWVMDYDVLKTAIQGKVTMKFPTAAALFLGGLTAISIFKRYYLLFFVPYLFVLLSPLLFPEISQWIANVFGDINAYTFAPQVPSIATIFLFWVFAIGVIILKSRRHFGKYKNTAIKTVRYFGKIIEWAAMIAGLGYCINAPILYYYIDNVSSAMAIHTALLFTHMGLWMEILASTLLTSDKK